jgi:hypothetical protein
MIKKEGGLPSKPPSPIGGYLMKKRFVFQCATSETLCEN